MPARIVIVHDDTVFLGNLAARLRGDGHDVATFADPVEAWDALEAIEKTEVLVTRLAFAEGRSNGMALARKARSLRRSIRTLILCRPEYVEEIGDEAEILLSSASLGQVAEAVLRMLDAP